MSQTISFGLRSVSFVKPVVKNLFVFATTLFVADAACAAEAPYGLDARTPWSSSNFHGRPEPPPPFRPEIVYPQLRFDKTTALAYEPTLDRFFVGQRDGKVFVLPKDRNAEQADLFLDCAALVEPINAEKQTSYVFDSLYGLTFDPDFATNRYCYACYVIRPQDRNGPQVPDGTRVVRFRVTDTEPPRCDPASEELIIAWLHGGHNGGCIKFGPDGNLYISSGDGGVAFPPDGLNSGQDLTRLLSKVLRIDVRRSENGLPYAIPADNPFVDVPGARGETWSYGMRNPWKMSFDRQTGDLWVGDVGWELWELVYKVQKGDNYGWSIVEGSQPVHTERQRGPTPIVPPIMEIPHTEGASVTGGFVYRGKKYPELVGHYVFGDWETRRMWGVPTEGPALKGKPIGERYEIIDPTVRIVDFAEDADGELYLLDHDDGTISTLVPNPTKGEPSLFPRKLSDSGIFASVERHEPAPGVLPFSVNVDQWSDGAVAERMVGVPGTETIHLHAKPKLIPGSQFSRAVDWPAESIVLKTLSLEMRQGDPASRRRIETQVLHYDGREWQGYTYEWNAAETDAALVERNGKNVVLEVQDADSPGGRRTQTWRFSSRNECLRCHNPWSEYTLAFNLGQLNRPHDYGSVTANQIRTFRHIGLFTDVIEEPDPQEPFTKLAPAPTVDELAKLTTPFDASHDVADRARSYLHVNCGHCHRFNGGGSSYIYLQQGIELSEMRAVGVRPTQGTFGIHDAHLVAPGDPYRSVLYMRLAKTGPGHMPHLGAKIVDERALALVRDWIVSLPVRNDEVAKIERLIAADEATALERQRVETPMSVYRIAARAAKAAGREKPNAEDRSQAEQQVAETQAAAVKNRAADRRKLINELLETPPAALLLAEAVRDGRIPVGVRDQILEKALEATTDPAIRDVFEAFVPEELRTKRLGEVVDVAALLSLPGDVERGRKMFHESTVVLCRNCHQVDKKGTELGPPLDYVGRKYDRAKILENILQPSLQVDPKYASWLVETADGLVVTGLLVERNDAHVVLRDSQNKVHRIPAADVDGIFPQNKSIMPEMQFRDFTAQQAADLLEYLTTLRAPLPADADPAASR